MKGKPCSIIGLRIRQNGVRRGAKTEGETEPRRWGKNQIFFLTNTKQFAFSSDRYF